jgi:hypothetical protein
LVCISWHLSPSQWHISQIPPISLCVCMCIPLLSLGKGLVKGISPFVARQQPGKDVPAGMKNCWRHRFLCSSWHIKESRWLLLPRTPYLFHDSIQLRHWKCNTMSMTYNDNFNIIRKSSDTVNMFLHIWNI